MQSDHTMKASTAYQLEEGHVFSHDVYKATFFNDARGGVRGDGVRGRGAGYSPMTLRKKARALPPVILMMSASE